MIKRNFIILTLLLININLLSQKDSYFIEKEDSCYILNTIIDKMYSNALNIIANQWNLELCYFDGGCIPELPDQLKKKNEKSEQKRQEKYGKDWMEKLFEEAEIEKNVLLDLNSKLIEVEPIKSQRDKLNSQGIGILFSYEKNLKPRGPEYTVKGYGRKYSKGEYEYYLEITLDYINNQIENVRMKILKNIDTN